MADTQAKQGTKAEDQAGGVEGGMPAGSAGGPGQPDGSRSNANESDGDDGGAAKPGTANKVDLGQGSHEQTQGRTR